MWIAVSVALALAALAAAFSVVSLRRTSLLRTGGSQGTPLPGDVLGLRQEVAALREAASGALRHLSVVRYDAFGDMGGHLSWSVALLDDAGDGLVLTSIHGRSESRTYAKSVSGWTSDQQLSPEESEAVSHARP